MEINLNATVVHTKHTLALHIRYGDFDHGEDSDTGDRFPSPLSIPTVHADEFPGDLDAASVPADWKTENGKRRLVRPVQPSRIAIPRYLPHTYMASPTRASCTASGSSRTACFSLPEVSVLPIYSTYTLVLWSPYFMRKP